MNNYISQTRNILIGGKYDIIVAGGGPSGSVAAIAAGRSGMKTLLIEQFGCAGGMWTSGLVNPLFDYRNKKGIIIEIQKWLADNNVWGGFAGICFQYEYMKYLLDKMLSEAGVDVLYYTNVTDAYMDGKTVKGVITENKEGCRLYLADVVIDCTGDADVAYHAGAEILIGRPEDSKCQALTLMFKLGNIDYMQDDCNEIRIMLEEAISQGNTDYKIPYDRPYVIQIPNTKTAVVQLTHMRGYNSLDPRDMSAALVEGRKQAMETYKTMKERIPLFKDIELLETAALMGIRETRRIVGEYTLTKEDLINGVQHDDSITIATFGIDIHNSDDKGQLCLEVKPYGIPYRCLIPKNINGLLVAGRSISGTHEAMASYRVTGNCAMMGESAAYAAYEAIKQSKDLRNVTIDEIMSHYNL